MAAKDLPMSVSPDHVVAAPQKYGMAATERRYTLCIAVCGIFAFVRKKRGVTHSVGQGGTGVL
tara:strand:+ start:632 stop:820 length:189 start_codon:yes stop_codon:yes gene_type:complete